MQDPKPFRFDARYAAAWTHEVGRRETLARTVCGRKLALWRGSDGTAVALEDACWHAHGVERAHPPVRENRGRKGATGTGYG